MRPKISQVSNLGAECVVSAQEVFVISSAASPFLLQLMLSEVD